MYSTASTSDAVYIIGGNDSWGKIVRFKHGAWAIFGQLAKGRVLHGSIAFEEIIMVIGGGTFPGK